MNLSNVEEQYSQNKKKYKENNREEKRWREDSKIQKLIVYS